MSPGPITEKLHFLVAAVDDGDRLASGGGEVDEGEEIQDGKTIMLLQHAAMVGLAGL